MPTSASLKAANARIHEKPGITNPRKQTTGYPPSLRPLVFIHVYSPGIAMRGQKKRPDYSGLTENKSASNAAYLDAALQTHA